MIESLKQPEYTGENRCLPCTAVNVSITVVLAAVPIALRAGAVVTVPWSWIAAVSGGVLAVSLALIYLRGYLVPGTPTLTKRYLPERVLELFGKAPEPMASGAIDASTDESIGDGDGSGAVDDRSPEEFLLAVGAVEPCEDGADLCLTDAFRSAWDDEIAADRESEVSAETITRRLGIPDDECEINEYRGSWVLQRGGRRLAQWPSKAALIADSAAAAALSDWTDQWEVFSPVERSELVAGLRLFLEDCPTAGGGVEFDEETVESCCRQQTVVTLSCAETGERLLEVPAPDGA